MASTNQDVNSVQVSLSQMLDLALGTPEVGAINFNILHNFLHVLLHQIDLQSTNIEYRGGDVNGIEKMVASLKPGSHETDTWHVINTDKISDVNAKGINKSEFVGSSDAPNDELKLLDERVTELETNLIYLNDDFKNFKEDQILPGTAKEVQSVASKLRPEIPTTLSKSEHELTATSKSDQQFSKTMLKHSENSFREASELIDQKPIKVKTEPPDMDTEREISNSVSKIAQSPDETFLAPKIEKQESWVAESSSKQKGQSNASIIRRGSVIGGVDLNELKKDVSVVKDDIAQSRAELSELKNEMGKVKQNSIELFSHVKKLQETVGTYIVSTETDANAVNLREVPSSQSDTKTPKVLLSTRTQSRADIQAQNLIQTPTVVETPDHAVTSPTPLNVRQMEDVAKTASTTSLTSVPVSAKIKQQTSNTFGNIPVGSGQNKLMSETTELFGNLPKDEGQKIQLMEAIRNMEIMYGEAMRNLDFRVIELENHVKFIDEKIGDLQNGVRCGNDGIQEIQELVDRIHGIQGDIEKINQTAARLCEEKENRDIHTKALGEQIELLKNIKADKEDLEDALADKADARIVNRKVSCDKFDSTCDDLARGLDDAILKLTRQETIWQQALDAVQQEVESKLDKIEISPIREFVNNQLKVLQDKLKKLDEKRRENEAAGTRKILTDVQCISCDKNVVMKIAEGVSYRSDPLSASKSIKPYLTYELDQVRKQQKKLPGRSMIQFAGAIQESGRKSKLAKDDHMDKTSRDHFCNRYCGGSHTITNAHQRVMRMGHFLAQWGPEAVQLTEGKVRGTDGQLYKSRPLPPGAVTGKPDVCDPCVCEDTKTERTSSPNTNRTDDPSSPPKTSQMNQSRKASMIQASSRRPSSKKILESVEDIRSTLSLRRGQKSVVSNAPPATIEEEKHPESPSLSQTVSPQQASIIKNSVDAEEDEEDLNEEFEIIQESV